MTIFVAKRRLRELGLQSCDVHLRLHSAGKRQFLADAVKCFKVDMILSFEAEANPLISVQEAAVPSSSKAKPKAKTTSGEGSGEGCHSGNDDDEDCYDNNEDDEDTYYYNYYEGSGSGDGLEAANANNDLEPSRPSSNSGKKQVDKEEDEGENWPPWVTAQPRDEVEVVEDTARPQQPQTRPPPSSSLPSFNRGGRSGPLSFTTILASMVTSMSFLLL